MNTQKIPTLTHVVQESNLFASTDERVRLLTLAQNLRKRITDLRSGGSVSAEFHSRALATIEQLVVPLMKPCKLVEYLQVQHKCISLEKTLLRIASRPLPN